MTDMQVRAQANEIAEQQAYNQWLQAKASERQAKVAARRAAEEHRANKMMELRKYQEMLSKYGYDQVPYDMEYLDSLNDGQAVQYGLNAARNAASSTWRDFFGTPKRS